MNVKERKNKDSVNPEDRAKRDKEIISKQKKKENLDQKSGGGEKRRKNLRKKEIRRMRNEKGEGEEDRAKLVIYGAEKGKRNGKIIAVEAAAITISSTNVWYFVVKKNH
jgi:hypothetical protein